MTYMIKRIYYTDGNREIRIKPGETIPKGFRKGRMHPCNTTSDTVKINNGEVEKHWPKGEKLPDDYQLGRLPKNLNPKKQSQTLRDKQFHHYNNGIKEIFISQDEPIPEGFIPGRLPMTIEQKQKISQSHIGKHHTDESKKKISENSNNNREKAQKTYEKETGYPNPFSNPEVREKIEETKRTNGTFNTSKPEEALYEQLVNTYGKNNVLRNYKKDPRYPFRCDFYIRSKDLFIELNNHWTHGKHPFDPNNKEDLDKLLEWKEKSKVSAFYRQAIQTWTVRDPLKIKTAKDNKIHYICLYE